MKVLLLGPENGFIEKAVTMYGDEFVGNTEEPITPDTGAHWLVSYGYRHIVGKDVLDKYGRRALNLHISYLPWNRGADPNLWSFLEDTPKGVTLHVMDEGIDTGDIIAQRYVEFYDNDTLSTMYARLKNKAEWLFFETWPLIRAGRAGYTPQPDFFTYHRSIDKSRYLYLLDSSDPWATPVAAIAGAATI